MCKTPKRSSILKTKIKLFRECKKLLHKKNNINQVNNVLLEIEICESSSRSSPFKVHVTVGMGLPEISHDNSVSPCSSTNVWFGSLRITGASAAIRTM